MRHIKKISAMIFAGITIMFSSCIKDEITIEPGFNRPLNMAVPVIDARFKAMDLIDRLADDDYVYIDNDSLIIARITDTTFLVTYDEIIEIKDISTERRYDIDPLKSTNVTFQFKDTISTDLKDDQRLDSTLLKNGSLEITVIPPSGYYGTWNLDFPDITMPGGNKLHLSGNLNTQTTVQENMSGVKINFFQTPDKNSAFEMITSVDAQISGVPTGTEIVILFRLTNSIPKYLFGFFGTDTIMKQKNNVDIIFFNENEYLDIFEFKDVILNLTSKSMFGAPVVISLDTVNFRNTGSGDMIDLQIPDENSVKLDPAIFDPLNGTVTPAIDSLQLNKDNSNLEDVINIMPDEMYYSVAEVVNPDGDTGIPNFLINDGQSSIDGRINIDIPLWFKAEKYERSDTLDFDIKNVIDDSTTIDYVKEMNFYFDFENGMPFTIYAQGYLLDDYGTVIDSLFTGEQKIWKSPDIDADGKAIGTAINSIDVNFDHDKVKRMYDKHVTRILIESKFNTGDETNPEFVKLYSYYKVNMKMSFDIKSSDKPL